MLFCSGDDCLCHDFEIPELPDFIQSKLQKPQGPAPDLKEYDRLLIYTDGSSKPTGRRMAPLRADELGLQDTWAFLVLGEKYDERGDSSTIVPIGWTAQPVSYQPEGQAFTGTQRIGSYLCGTMENVTERQCPHGDMHRFSYHRWTSIWYFGSS